MSGSDLRTRFFSNVRAHVGSRIVQGAVGLLLVPWVLAHLTRDEYGLWSWLLAVSGWLTLADLGLSYGNVNPLTRSLAAKDDRRVGEILFASVGLQILLTAVFLLAVLVASDAITGTLPSAEREIGARTLLILVLAQGLGVASLPFGSLLSALQRLDLVYKVQSAQLLLQAAATVVILLAGGRVLALAWLQVWLGGFQLAARAILCRRLHPAFRFARPAVADLPSLLSAGLPVVVLAFAGNVLLTFERTYLGFVVELALVAQYAVAVRLVMTIREIPQVLLSALVPASAALDVAGDDAGLERLYRRSFKLSLMVVFGVTAILGVCSSAALAAWLGDGFEAAGAVARPLAVAILVPLITAPGVHVMTGRSRLAPLTPLYLAWAAAFVIGNVAWLSATGFAGAGWGAAVIDVVGTAVFLRAMHGESGLRIGGGAALVLRGAGSAIVAAVIGQAVVWLGTAALGDDGRIAALAVALAGAATITVIHLALSWAAGLVDRDDLGHLAAAIRFR